MALADLEPESTNGQTLSIGALPNSSYSIIAPDRGESAPIRHKHKHHATVRNAH